MTNIEISLLIIIFLLLCINLYLLTRRRFLIKNVPIDIAEYMVMLNDNIIDGSKQHSKSLLNFSKELNRFEQIVNDSFDSYSEKIVDTASNNEITLSKTVNFLKYNLESVNAELVEIKNQLNALQQYTIEKEKKIRRFEDGYDYKIKNRMITDIISLLDHLEKLNRKIQNEVLSEAIEDILLLLENNGVHAISLEQNLAYIGSEQTAKVDRVEDTTKDELDGLIKETVKKGFYLDVDGVTKKLIRPCSVVLYKLKRGEE